MRMVNCVKLKQELPGLDKPPFPNALGQRIYESVSKDGFKEWIKHSTMLINEYLRGQPLTDKRSQEFLLKQCEEFFFGDGGQKPAEFVPVEKENAPKTP